MQERDRERKRESENAKNCLEKKTGKKFRLSILDVDVVPKQNKKQHFFHLEKSKRRRN